MLRGGVGVGYRVSIGCWSEMKRYWKEAGNQKKQVFPDLLICSVKFKDGSFYIKALKFPSLPETSTFKIKYLVYHEVVSSD